MFCSGRFPTPLKDEKIIYAPLAITSVLADGLAKKGHKVHLFGAEGSFSKAKIETLGLPPLRKNRVLASSVNIEDPRIVNFYEQIFISEIYRRANKGDFDIVHIHPVDAALPLSALSKTPTVFTLHDPISPWRKFIYSRYKDRKNLYYISISKAQQKPLKSLNYAANIYHGLDLKKYPFEEKPDDYYLIASRLIPQKGVDIAVKIARDLQIPLKIAGDKPDEKYWNVKIKPYLGGKIEYIGFVPPKEMPTLYSKAKAFLFPLQWEEPFGLVMAEAQACGTPVVAFRRGSAPELVQNGKTGFVVNPLDESGEINYKGFSEAIKNIEKISRRQCRKRMEENFSLEKMINEHEKTFLKIVRKKI